MGLHHWRVLRLQQADDVETVGSPVRIQPESEDILRFRSRAVEELLSSEVPAPRHRAQLSRRYAPRPLLGLRARIFRIASHPRRSLRLRARGESNPRSPLLRFRVIRSVAHGSVLRSRAD